MAIGKITLEQIRTRIATGLGVEAPTPELFEKIRNELNIMVKAKVDEICKDKEQRLKYIIEQPIITTGLQYNLATITDYKDTDNLYLPDYGDISYKEYKDIENYINNKDYENSYIYTVYGYTLKVIKGALITPAAFNFVLFYLRQPADMVLITDKIDLEDRYVEDLINKMITKLSTTEPAKEVTE